MSNVKYYTAKWCSPCKQLLPKVEKWAEWFGHDLEIVDIEDMEGDELQGVTSVPVMKVDNQWFLNAAEIKRSLKAVL